MISYYDNGWVSLPANHTGYSTLAACGMNVVNSSLGKSPPIDLDLAQQYGLWAMVDWDPGGTVVIPNDAALLDARAQSLVNQYSHHPALLGFRLRDEPSADEFPQIALLHQKLLQYDPTCLPWLNILPNYSYGAYGTGVSSHKQYLDAFINTVKPKVLCYDDYTAAGNTTYPSNNYDFYWDCSNLERFREYGKQHQLPYWRIIESNLGSVSLNTEGIFRYQTYSSLAYGFTGILYFTYTQQNGTSALAYYQGQAGEWGAPTAKHATARKVNMEVKTLAPLLMKLTSWSVHHSNPGMSPPVSVPAEDVETFNGVDNFYVTEISGGNMLYGTFVDRGYRSYLLFVNKDYVSARSFTVALRSSNVAGLGRVSKTTGRLVHQSTAGSMLSLTLSAGNGELYKVLLDTTAASTPLNLVGSAQCSGQVLLNWADSADPQSGVDYYVVYRDGVEIGISDSSDHLDTGLATNATYRYEVSAVNGEGLESPRSLPADVHVMLQLKAADFDQDCDVDAADFSQFLACASGPAVQVSPTCVSRDLDGDGDCDMDDFGLFQRCFSGFDTPAPPDCP